jgi:hypothetical protein
MLKFLSIGSDKYFPLFLLLFDLGWKKIWI